MTLTLLTPIALTILPVALLCQEPSPTNVLQPGTTAPGDNSSGSSQPGQPTWPRVWLACVGDFSNVGSQIAPEAWKNRRLSSCTPACRHAASAREYTRGGMQRS
jgi:hypothetical protein